MIKRYFIFISLAFLVSCSGYFLGNNGAIDRNPGDLHLALADGSGYLSSDQFNEINPFMFHDKNKGKNYLFYSSDKDSSYDIYYAEMNLDGKFKNPVKMGNLINTSADEFSPVLLQTPISNYIIFLRGQSGITNLILCFLDENLNYVSETNLTPFISPLVPNHISGIKSDDNTILLLIADGSSAFNRYSVTDSDTAGYIRFNWDFTTNFNSTMSSVCGYRTQSTYSYNYFLLFDTMKSGIHQLNGEAIIQGYGIFTMQFALPSYSSLANDKDPFVDADGGYKVYFASDRYGKGNYDLYRYNTTTFDAQIPSNLKVPFNTIYVAPSPAGNDANAGILPSSPLLTIQSAISYAFSMGIQNVFVASGSYTLNSGLNSSSGVEIYSKSNINLIGGFNNSFTALAGKSELDMGGNNYPIFYISYSYNLTINNFIIRNALGSGTRGVYINSVSNISFINDIISNNGSIYSDGGGLNIYGSVDIKILGGSILYNIGQNGGGLNVNNSSFIDLENTVISLNNANSAGGGFEADYCSNINILNSTFSNNITLGNGGGIHFYGSTNIDINNSSFITNIANNGGAIYMENSYNYNINVNYSDNIPNDFNTP